jgi:hypothetical protein
MQHGPDPALITPMVGIGIALSFLTPGSWQRSGSACGLVTLPWAERSLQSLELVRRP